MTSRGRLVVTSGSKNKNKQKTRWRRLKCETRGYKSAVHKPMVDVRGGVATLNMDVKPTWWWTTTVLQCVGCNSDTIPCVCPGGQRGQSSSRQHGVSAKQDMSLRLLYILDGGGEWQLSDPPAFTLESEILYRSVWDTECFWTEVFVHPMKSGIVCWSMVSSSWTHQELSSWQLMKLFIQHSKVSKRFFKFNIKSTPVKIRMLEKNKQLSLNKHCMCVIFDLFLPLFWSFSWHFPNCTTIWWNRIKCHVSVYHFQQGVLQGSSWPGGLLGCPSKTHELSRSGVAAVWPFALFHWKGTPTGLLFGFENMFFYVPGSVLLQYHSTILIIMTLNENPHTGPIFKHTKELRCSSASQYEFGYWVARYEAECWCFIILNII